MTSRPRLCRFFQEDVTFLIPQKDSRELLFPSNMSGTASISGILSGPVIGTGPMLLFGAVRSNPKALDKSDEFFHVMNKVICLEEGDLEDVIEAIRGRMPEDCHTAHNSEEEMDYDDDSHIAQFCAHPAVCRRLQRFTAGDSNTGCGRGVWDEDVFIRFHWPNIEMICLTGHDKVHGNVSGTALKTLASRPYLAPKLKSLSLIDQQTGVQSGVKVLSRARPMLWIYTGDTVGNSMAAQSLGEEEQMFTWLGGKIVGV
ncbi:hypothetical protein R3P38DRAFT_2909401 [Favolaschia claudopus]|uniref:Uncharacterized protein n=1 Tax=Favolaschia claudopus TaxID=2862362 RepID=A0AAW0CB24_9AGAR